MHGLKDSVRVGSIHIQNVKKVKPEVFELDGAKIDKVKILGQANDHLIKCHGALRVGLHILIIVALGARSRTIRVRAHRSIQKLVLLHCLVYQLVFYFVQDGKYLVDYKVEKALRVDFAAESPPAEHFQSSAERLNKFMPLVLPVVILQQKLNHWLLQLLPHRRLQHLVVLQLRFVEVGTVIKALLLNLDFSHGC